MMSSQQNDEGDFPPNPFLSNDDAASAGPPAAAAPSPSSFDSGSGSSAPLPPPGVPPMPREQDTFADDSTSFQPVDAGYVGSGAMDTKFAGGQQVPPAQQQQQGGLAGGPGMGPSVNVGSGAVGGGGFLANVQSCLSLDTYRKYFDVDTADIEKRIVGAVKMCNIPDAFRFECMGVNSAEGKGPDLYGPFWLTNTMVFFLAVTSNMHGYLHRDDVQEFEADISHLIRAMSVLYIYTFLLPFLLFLVFRCAAIPLPLMELICLYGYSLVPYAPVTVLCLIPVPALEWIFILVATGASCLLVLRNVASPILGSGVSQSKAPALVMCVIGCHIIFFLVLKLTFYHHRPAAVAPST